MAVAGLEEKYDAVRQLIAVGKERGYLLYDEVNDSLPAEVHSSEEIDDLLTTFERNGIEIYEDQASAKAARAVEFSVETEERDGALKEDAHEPETDLDLTPGSLEKTNDPVRMYLREMGTVPLLTREGEVTIAKRIERGQLVVLKTITRSPIVIKELIAVGEDCARARAPSRKLFSLTTKSYRRKNRQQDQADAQAIEKIAQIVRRRAETGGQTGEDSQSKKSLTFARSGSCPHAHGNFVAAALSNFNPFEKKRLIDKMRDTVERLQSLEREAGRSSAVWTSPKAIPPPKRARNSVRDARNSRTLKTLAKSALPNSSARSLSSTAAKPKPNRPKKN